jgi:hypothetical protein
MDFLNGFLWSIILGAFGLGWYYYANFKTKKAKEKTNEYLYDWIPGMFPTIGIFTTVFGISIGLYKFNTEDISGSIPELLNGLKFAFWGTVAGIVGLVIFSWRNAVKKHKLEQEREDFEVAVLKEIRNLNQENENKYQFLKDIFEKQNALIESIENNLSYVDAETKAKVRMVNILKDVADENKKQTNALTHMASDLSQQMEQVFDKVVNNEEKGLLQELRGINTSIQELATKLQSPAQDMTQNIVKDLQKAMQEMMEEFKNSVNGGAKAEMEAMMKNLTMATDTLNSFPTIMDTLKNDLSSFMSELGNTTKGTADEMGNQAKSQAKAISEQTLIFTGQIESLIEKLNAQTDTTAKNIEAKNEEQRQAIANTLKGFDDKIQNLMEVLKDNVGVIQKEQKGTAEIQKLNIDSTEVLLNKFDTSIKGLSDAIVKINENIENLNQSHDNLNTTSNSFGDITKNLSESTVSLKENQNEFKNYSTSFLKENANNLKAIENNLKKAQDVSTDYAEKFEVIEEGLKNIFAQIDTGLQKYQSAVNSGVNEFLTQYTTSVNNIVNSLSSAIESQNDLLEELQETIDKIKR